MTTINSPDDFLRALDANPSWREAVRTCILGEELLQLPVKFDAFAQEQGKRLENVENLVQEQSSRLENVENLNQYQGGMCISGVLKTTERTPQHPISPLSSNWVATDSAV